MRISTVQLNLQAIDAILDQQAQAGKTQLQLATGRRILTPADDPVAAARALALEQSVAVTAQYQTNIDVAESRLKLEEGAISGVETAIQRLRELAIQANTDGLDDNQRAGIASEATELRNELVRLANTVDEAGDYLFSGYRTRTLPFTENSAGVVTYNGDSGVRMLAVGPGRQIADGNNGSELFMNIANGNGTFQVSPAGGNTGSGIIDQGAVIGAFTADTYQLNFAQAGAGAPITYEVRRDPAGANTLVASGTYTPGSAIVFGGVAGAQEAQVTVTGTPANGDSYTITPSGPQDLFTTVNNFISAIQAGTAPPTADANFHSAMNRVLEELELAQDNFLRVHASVGSRLNAVEQQRNINAEFKLRVEETLSEVQDLDIAEAVSRLNLQLVSLQAAQQSYMKIQGLSLFNFL